LSFRSGFGRSRERRRCEVDKVRSLESFEQIEWQPVFQLSYLLALLRSSFI
jgi:hypothetical protein